MPVSVCWRCGYRLWLLVVLAVIDRAPRVLVVDDNPAMRRVLCGLLDDVGMEVVGEATDGLEGSPKQSRCVRMGC